MSTEINAADSRNDEEIGFLRFLIAEEYYAFPILGVQEIITMQRITRVPEFPEYAKGIINIRGTVIPIIDTRLRFHMPEIEYTRQTCIITINCRDTVIGFIVDNVDSVVQIRKSAVMPPPGLTSHRSEYINGVVKINGEIIMLLDTERMMTDDMFDAVMEGMNGMETE